MRLQTIQKYRGVVVVIITISHAIEVFGHRGYPGLNILKTRTGGVDFFFTLSGFLIFFAFFKYAGNLTAIKDFLVKRIIRIYPLVWLFTLLSLPIYFLQLGIGAGTETRLSSILGSLLLLPQSVDPVLGATWSLSHVVLFYLIFSLYLWKSRYTTVAVVVWVLLILLNSFFFGPESKENFLHVWKGFLLSPFNVEFLLGSALAKQAMVKKFKYGSAGIFAGCMFFVVGWLCFEKNTDPLIIAATYCSASLMLIYGGVSVDSRYKLNFPKFSDAVSNASYAIIIVNLPIIVAFSRVCDKVIKGFEGSISLSCGVVLGAVLLAILGGIFAHRVIEPLTLRVTKYLYQR